MNAWTLSAARGLPDAGGHVREWTSADAGRLARKGEIATDRGPIRVSAHFALVLGETCIRCTARKVVPKAGGWWCFGCGTWA